MQRSGSQKALLVLSIINIVFAVIGLLGALAMILGGAVFSALPASEASEALAGSGMTQGEVGGVMGIFGVVLIIGCAIELIVGILGVRAANDNRKIMPVWVLAIIDVVLYVISLIMTIVNGDFSTSGLTTIISLVFAALIFWIANNIKKEAGR